MSLATHPQKDGFSYAGDSFYREASNLSRHRRATLLELTAHFNGKDPENRPAHWYEAQLLHYGLPPSKVKGTAHKRLFDAVMKGDLAVPAHIQKVEADLKKEWKKMEREAKKAIQDKTTSKAPAKGTKRKAEPASTSTSVNVNVSVNVSSTGVVEVQPAPPAAKKAKATPKTTEKGAPKAAAKAAPKTAKKTAPKPATKATPKTTEKSTAAKSTPATAAPKTKAAPAAKPKAPPKQTAPIHSQGEDDIPPPPYSEYDPGDGLGAQTAQQSSPQPKIGLLNGQYSVNCPHVEHNFPEYEGELSLIATLDGKTLWLNFKFGIATGIMKVSRPYEVDQEHGSIVFWRGNALQRGSTDHYPLVCMDTVSRAGPLNTIFFLGDGHIRGSLHFGSRAAGTDVKLSFDAYRLFGQSMTSDIRPTEARQTWARLDERANSMEEDW